MMNSQAIALLEWDSTFFSKKIGTVTHIEKLTLDELSCFDLVVNKVSAGDYLMLDKLSDFNFRVAEGVVEFSKTLSTSNMHNFSDKVYKASTSHIAKLVDLASNSYKNSRYREPWFTSEQRSNFYGTWIENAILGKFDDICLFIKEDDVIQGFISLKKIESVLTIGLIAVSPCYRGQGIGTQLLKAAEQYAYENDCVQISVATQVSNVSASNLYIRNNFFLFNTSYWLYKDKNDSF